MTMCLHMLLWLCGYTAARVVSIDSTHATQVALGDCDTFTATDATTQMAVCLGPGTPLRLGASDLALTVDEANDVQIFNVTTGDTLWHWLPEGFAVLGSGRPLYDVPAGSLVLMAPSLTTGVVENGFTIESELTIANEDGALTLIQRVALATGYTGVRLVTPGAASLVMLDGNQVVIGAMDTVALTQCLDAGYTVCTNEVVYGAYGQAASDVPPVLLVPVMVTGAVGELSYTSTGASCGRYIQRFYNETTLPTSICVALDRHPRLRAWSLLASYQGLIVNECDTVTSTAASVVATGFASASCSTGGVAVTIPLGTCLDTDLMFRCRDST